MYKEVASSILALSMSVTTPLSTVCDGIDPAAHYLIHRRVLHAVALQYQNYTKK